MVLNKVNLIVIFSVLSLLAAAGFASEAHHSDDHARAIASEHAAFMASEHPSEDKAGAACENFEPQTPRDIDGLKGTNPQSFSIAPKSKYMNLCNIHFHNNAEHKAKDFAIYAGEGEHSHGGGYQCNISKSLTATELKKTGKNYL